jgi:uncharacterized protein YceK
MVPIVRRFDTAIRAASYTLAVATVLSLLTTAGCSSVAQDMKGAAGAAVQQQGQHQSMVKQENEIIDESSPPKQP